MKEQKKPRSCVMECTYTEEGTMSVHWTPLLLTDIIPGLVGFCGLEGRTKRWVFEVVVLYKTIGGIVWQMVAAKLIDWPEGGQFFLRTGGLRDEVLDEWTWRGPLEEIALFSFEFVEPCHKRIVQTPLDFTVRETYAAVLAHGIRGVPATSPFSVDFPVEKALKRLVDGAMV